MSARGDEDFSKRTFWERLKESFYKERFEKCKKKTKIFSTQDLLYSLTPNKHTSGVFSGRLR